MAHGTWLDMLHMKYNLWLCKAYTGACVSMKSKDAKLSLHPLYLQCELPIEKFRLPAIFENMELGLGLWLI